MNFTLKKSDLNFKVYTVEAKPTAPGADNDIAVISSVPMTNWIMSPENPSGIPRNDGDVWIQYSTKGDTFNALKQNSLMIATISAWQYVDGAWVERKAVSCHGGEWVDWIMYLYSPGDERKGITGGWEDAWTSGSYYTEKGTVSKNTNGITMTASGDFTSIYAKTKRKIDVTAYKTLSCVADSTKGFFGLGDGQYWSSLDSMVASGTTANGRSSVDVSTLEGEFYICLYVAAGNTITYSEVTLE